MKNIIFLLICTITASLNAFDLAKDNKACSAVIADKNELNQKSPTPWQFQIYKMAYDDFVKHLELAAGVKFNNPSAPNYILLGKAALTDDKLKAEASALAPGEYVIRTTGNDLRIFGKNIAGTICGMYAFLRDDVGIKFFGINDLFTVIPEKKIVSVRNIDRKVKPAFTTRILTPAYYPLDTGYLYGLRMGTFGFHDQDMMTANHALYRIFPGKIYAKTHPEYYSVSASGKSYAPTDGNAVFWQLCLSNPDVKKIVAKHLDINMQRGYLVTSLNPNDSMNYCACSGCAKKQPPRKEKQCYTDAFTSWVAEVSADAAKKYPGKYVGMLAYGGTTHAPLKKIPNNIFVGFTPDVAQHYDKTFQESELKNIRDWYAKTDGTNPFGWHSYVGSCQIAPAYFPHLFGNTLKDFYYKYNFRSFFSDGFGLPVFNEPQNYVLCRLLWDPSLDIDVLLNEYFNSLYGKGGTAVKALYDQLEKSYTRPRKGGRWLKNHSTLEAFNMYNAEDLASFRKLQKSARIAVKGNADAEKRLNYIFSKMDIIFNYMEIYLKASQLADGKANAKDIEYCINSLDSLEKDYQKHIRQDATLAQYAIRTYIKNSDYTRHVREFFNRYVSHHIAAALVKLAKSEPSEFARLRKLYETDNIKSASLKLQIREAAVRENLLLNPDFEEAGKESPKGIDWKSSGIKNWAYFTQSTLSIPGISQKFSYSGDSCASISGASGVLLQYANLDFSDGNRLFRCDVYAAVDKAANNASLTVAWGNKKGRMYLAGTYNASVKLVPGKWHHLEIIAEAPKDATHAIIHLNGTINDGGHVFFDKAAFRKIIFRK